MHNAKEYVNIYVVIPIYNCKQYIENAVNSVLNQPYTNIKIILINDGSTDGSDLICNRLAVENTRITVLHQDNKGVSAARNLGIEHVLSNTKDDFSKSYIAFLDGDDAWTSCFFNNELANIIDSDYDLIGFQSCLCDEKMEFRAAPEKIEPGEYLGGKNSIWKHGQQSFAAMLYKIDLLKKYNIRFRKIKYSEDKIFSMECMYLANKIYICKKLQYLYRQNKFSAMKKRSQGIQYYEPIINAYLQFDEDMDLWRNDSRGQLLEGHVLARIYIMDMIDEHIQNFGSIKEITKYMCNHTNYIEILQSPIAGDSIQQRYLNMFNNRKSYVIRNRLNGIAKFVIKIISKITFVNKIYNRRRYTIKI